MKLVIAFAAVLTSAALTVPTVTGLGDSHRPGETRVAASTGSEAANENA